MNIKQAPELIKDNLIVKHYAGSIAYGTNLPTSDVDFRGIFTGDPVNIRTPFFKIEESKDATEEDTVIYELSQFMKLALDCNPNIIESLWVDESSITFTTDAYKLLRSYAPQLLSSKIAFTTSGYSLAQLKRLKTSKQKVNYLPDLTKLCETLQQGIKDNLIDQSFIIRECGQNVLDFMILKEYIK